MKLVLTRRLPAEVESRLKSHFSVVCLEKGRPTAPEELERTISDCDVLICTITDRVDGRLLSKAKRLKFVATFSAGLDHLDLPALVERGVKLSSTPVMLTETAADLTWALILACCRRLRPAIQFMEEGRFQGFDPCLFLGKSLSHATLGIVGMGKIGTAVGARAMGFGMKVVYHEPSAAARESKPGRAVELGELLSQADVLSLHCPLTSQTHHLIGRRELGAMKRDAVLINTARGAVVDEAALATHLRAHPEFYAGLDVFEHEPKVAAELLALPNAVCLPHLGSATRTTRAEMAAACAEEAIRFVTGEPLQNEVSLA